MDAEEMRRFDKKLEVRLEETQSRLDSLKERYADLIVQGRETADETEQKRLASEAQNVRRQKELRERDFHGILKLRSVTTIVKSALQGAGSQTVELGQELKGMMDLPLADFKKEFDRLAEEHQTLEGEVEVMSDMLGEYTDTTSSAESSPELEMMQGEEDLEDLEGEVGETEHTAETHEEPDDENLELQ